MNDRTRNFELLREFVRRNDQQAFAAVVRRHLNLVYATALRKVEDEGAAEEISQNVFIALGRKAWRFSAGDSVAAWLYRTSHAEATQWVRSELRRRRREQTAFELGTTLSNTAEQTGACALLPLLDEGLLSLREKDRTALLLRYHQNQSLRQVGLELGIAEDAAQKRVAAAVQRLANFFQKRGFKTASVTATSAVLQQTASATPALAAASIVQTVIQASPPTFAGLKSIFSRFASMSKSQAVALSLVLVMVPVASKWERAQEATKQIVIMRERLEMDDKSRHQIMIEVERLRREASRLENAAFINVQMRNDRLEATRKLAELRRRVDSFAGSPVPQWQDDLPFAKVPKWALTNAQFVRRISPRTFSEEHIPPFDSFGKLSVWGEEILNVSGERQATLEASLREYLEEMNNVAAKHCSERDFSNLRKDAKILVVSELGQEGWNARDRFASRLRDILPDEKTLGLFAWIFSREPFWDELLVSSKTFRVRINGTGELARPSFVPPWELTDPADPPKFLRERLTPWFAEMGLSIDAFTRQQ
jgi:RNA polymerase sigma factor (sigma-70 family)